MSRLCKSLTEVAKNPRRVLSWLGYHGMLQWMSDEDFIKQKYIANLGICPDLKEPKTFNEKLQWLKLHDRNPEYTNLVDKIKVKDWVSERIGHEYVTRTLECWNSAEEIDISELPERFVLKANHDSGGLSICRDRTTFDLAEAKARLRKSLRRNYYWGCREWPYKNVEPRAFAEEYLEGGSSNKIIDYKFYCFSGEPKFLYVSQGLEDHTTARISFLNLDWSFAPFTREDYAPFKELPEKPESYEKMVELARILSSGIPFVRVDFFEYRGAPRFSEMTFTPCGGFMRFKPAIWDERIGEMLSLAGAYGDDN